MLYKQLGLITNSTEVHISPPSACHTPTTSLPHPPPAHTFTVPLALGPSGLQVWDPQPQASPSWCPAPSFFPLPDVFIYFYCCILLNQYALFFIHFQSMRTSVFPGFLVKITAIKILFIFLMHGLMLLLYEFQLYKILPNCFRKNGLRLSLAIL